MFIDVQRFDIRSGADEDEFLAADQAVQQEFANLQPGFIRRTTARAEGGGWMVVWFWADQASADAAEAAAGQSDACLRFGSFVDPESHRRDRGTDLDG